MKSAGTSTHVTTNNYAFFPDHTGMTEEETTPIWRYGKLEKKRKAMWYLKHLKSTSLEGLSLNWKVMADFDRKGVKLKVLI